MFNLQNKHEMSFDADDLNYLWRLSDCVYMFNKSELMKEEKYVNLIDLFV